jgi:hypothetical protein
MEESEIKKETLSKLQPSQTALILMSSEQSFEWSTDKESVKLSYKLTNNLPEYKDPSLEAISGFFCAVDEPLTINICFSKLVKVK